MADVVSVEEELVLRLAGVAAVRARESDRIRELARRADADELLRLLRRQRLMTLLGSRLLETSDDLVPGPVRDAVDIAVAESRHRHTLNAHLARDLCRRMECAGIEAVPLKGPLLAERIHADPALRGSTADLDFLVRAERFGGAIKLLEAIGYTIHDDTIWADGLPHYHYGLSPGRPGQPKVELHWRIHWYEKEFAPRLIERARLGSDGVRVPAAVDDLAALLIIFARDGFVGLRLAADIGAWWDAQGAALSPLALDSILAENPRLRPTLLAALSVAEDLIGLPSKALVSSHWRRSRRTRVAPLLLNWRHRGAPHEVAANITLIDLLLSPVAAAGVYFRHYYLQPVAKYARDYGWRHETKLRNQLRRAVHAFARVGKSGWLYPRKLWAVRHGRLDAIPPRSAPHGPSRGG